MRPVDVLALRDVLYRDLQFNESFKWSIGYTVSERLEAGYGQSSTAEALIQIAKSAIRAGEVFLVTEEMNELAEAAQKSMPLEPLIPADLPSANGFMWIDGGIQTTDVRGAMNSSSLITWVTVKSALHITTWSYKHDMKDDINSHLRKNPHFLAGAPTLMWTGFDGGLPFGEIPPVQLSASEPIPADADVKWGDDYTLLVDGKEVPVEEVGRNHELSWFICACRLMQQTLATTRREEVQAKKVRRFDLKDTLVSVITLRHARPSRENGETHVEWRHRWVVREHWRHQPYKGEDGAIIYRWILVAPYIKGPEGMPLKRSDKINVWKQ